MQSKGQKPTAEELCRQGIYKYNKIDIFMTLERGHWFILLFTLAYVLAYTIFYISIKNFEFLWYIFVLVFFFALIFFTLKKTKFD